MTIEAEAQGAVIARAIAGDEVAFARIVAAHHGDVARIAYLVCGSLDVAEEAEQAAWAKAWHRLGDVRDPVRLRPWLMSVAANEARQIMRGQKRRTVRELKLAGPASTAGPDRAALMDLAAALARLDTRDRAIVGLRYIAGVDSAEIGRAIGMSGSGDLWAVDIATGESVRLTDTPTVMEQQSDWSPDGSLVAYTSDCGDAWTPDGPCPWSIWTVRPDGSDRRRLTPEDGYVSAGPVWAPDGKHLAYTRDTTAPTDATVNGSVYVVDADGSDPHRITTFETGWAAVQGWSPDGSTIVVVHGVTDLATDEIDPIETWIMGADGSNPRILVPDTIYVDWVWSSAD